MTDLDVQDAAAKADDMANPAFLAASMIEERAPDIDNLDRHHGRVPSTWPRSRMSWSQCWRTSPVLSSPVLSWRPGRAFSACEQGSRGTLSV